MSLTRREFNRIISFALMAGAPILSRSALAGERDIYEAKPFGNLRIAHITDCHAQLEPIYFREPSQNIGVGQSRDRLPHLVGKALLEALESPTDPRDKYSYTYLDFDRLANQYGKVGGFAHIATLIKRLRSEQPNLLLLDGGDTWQGSWTSLKSNAQDMVDIMIALGVDVMTGHWEFTFGLDRVKEVVGSDFKKAKLDFVAQNVKTDDFGDQIFDPYVIRRMNGIPVAVIGQAFPYSPIANPSYMMAGATFGIQEESMRSYVAEARAKGAQVVIVLSHNGMDVDLKMASRVAGIDAIMGGHTHDGIPKAIEVKNGSGVVLVTNGGSNGKFIGSLDLDVRDGKIKGSRYRLLPVFSNLLKPDKDIAALIGKIRAPYLKELSEPLAKTELTLYRRGNFNGTFDQLIVDAMMKVQGAPIAFSPGFRWGTTVPAGETITRERLYDQTAITYPYSTLTEIKGEMIKRILEDVADNLFNDDPYYQQGGDMVRVGGLEYTIDPTKSIGSRISDMRLGGKKIDPTKKYKVAGWAPVAESAKAGNPRPIWDVVEEYLRSIKTVRSLKVNTPTVNGIKGNEGFAL